MRMYATLIVAILSVCTCAYEVPSVRVSLLDGGGISFAVPDEAGITLVAYHYSINKELIDVNAGDYNVDVSNAVDGFWRHDDTLVRVADGDQVNYWAHVVYNGAGYNKLNQQWTARNDDTRTSSPPTQESAASEPPAMTDPTESDSRGGTTTPMKPVARGELIFEDTFEFFNFDNWQHEITAGGGGNWEFQYYTNNRTNSYVRDNTLFIKPTLTEDKFGEGFLESGTLSLWGASPADRCTGNNWFGCQRAGTPDNIINPIQSARLRTVNSFAFKYGTMEVIAQMPKGDWIWPAIWLLSKHNAYGQWPASGEIDLVETRGNRNLRSSDGTHSGTEQVGMTLHWGPYWPLNGYPKTHKTAPNIRWKLRSPDTKGRNIDIEITENLPKGESFGDGFHNYTFQWTSEGMTFYLDNEVIMNVDPGTEGFWTKGGFEEENPGIENPWTNSPNKMAPFDREFYIILNVAVGGINYFSDDDINMPYSKPWENTSPTAARDFYDAKDNWYPTWNPDTNNGEDAAMKIKSVRVYALPMDGNSSRQISSNIFLLTFASVAAIVAVMGNKRA